MIVLEPSRRFFETQRFFDALGQSGMFRRDVRVGPVLASTIYLFDSSWPQTTGQEQWTLTQLGESPSELEKKIDKSDTTAVVGLLRFPWRNK
jgi:hypothetical protein